MPKCINNKNKYFKGTEPSPKGLGYSAYSEDVGTIKLGNNEHQRIVSENEKKNKILEKI